MGAARCRARDASGGSMRSRRGITLRHRTRLRSVGAIGQMGPAGIGVAILPQSAVAELRGAGLRVVTAEQCLGAAALGPLPQEPRRSDSAGAGCCWSSSVRTRLRVKDSIHAGYKCVMLWPASGRAAGALDIRPAIHRLGKSRPGGRRVQPGTEAVEMLEAHYQRPPFVGIDTVQVAIEKYAFMQMNALDAHLNRYDPSRLRRVVLCNVVNGPRRWTSNCTGHSATRGAPNRFRRYRRQAGYLNFLGSKR